MIKFNNGRGALICDNCGTIIKTPYDTTEYPSGLCDNCRTYDNFSLIEPLLEFNNTNEFYFCQIIQRKKDGNNVKFDYRELKSFYIYSKEELQKLKPRIIEICKNNNARAYLNLNRRNSHEVALECIKKYSDIILNNIPRGDSVWDSCCGVTRAKGYEALYLIDIDVKNINDTILDILKNCRGGDLNKLKAIVPTPQGYHFITSKFDTKQFSQQLIIQNLPNIDVHKNNPTLLYYYDISS